MDKTTSKKGYLIDAADINISYLPKHQYQEWMAGNGNLGVKIPIGNIESLKFRKNNRVGNSMLIGGLVGGVGLGLLAVASNSGGCKGGGFCIEFGSGAAFLIGFIPGGVAGAIIGSLVGHSKISIPIDGNLNSYKSQRDRIKEFILHPN